jgi:hypothetical protein
MSARMRLHPQHSPILTDTRISTSLPSACDRNCVALNVFSDSLGRYSYASPDFDHRKFPARKPLAHGHGPYSETLSSLIHSEEAMPAFTISTARKDRRPRPGMQQLLNCWMLEEAFGQKWNQKLTDNLRTASSLSSCPPIWMHGALVELARNDSLFFFKINLQQVSSFIPAEDLKCGGHRGNSVRLSRRELTAKSESKRVSKLLFVLEMLQIAIGNFRRSGRWVASPRAQHRSSLLSDLQTDQNNIRTIPEGPLLFLNLRSCCTLPYPLSWLRMRLTVQQSKAAS